MGIRLIGGDCREVLATLPANSVHCVVTSPPYYGLRDYGTAQWAGGDAGCDHTMPTSFLSSTLGASTGGRSDETHERSIRPRPYRDTCGKCGAMRVDRQIGLEATPDAYLAEMVAVFREVRRVLHPTGSVFCNMGDSYSDKQLLMMPARLALALQADGWWLRSDIIWSKPNPMPESVTDRPTSAHEHVFLLTRSSRYFYDADAVRESAEYGYSPTPQMFDGIGTATSSPTRKLGAVQQGSGGSRNLRNVWTLSTHSFPGAHFATFPPALAERCIRAGTSERGCCAACGAPWARQTERGDLVPTNDRGTRANIGIKTDVTGLVMSHNRQRDGHKSGMAYETTTTGWAASCACDAATVPCTVLDPFAGAGTTLLVADRLQRDAIGIELNPDYTRMAMDRCRDDAPLFAEPAEAEAPEIEEPRIRDLFA